MRFDKKRKLTPRYIGQYEIIKRIGRVAYQLTVPTSLECIHNVFHVSLLHKCLGDLSQVVGLNDIELEDNLVHQECLLQIVD